MKKNTLFENLELLKTELFDSPDEIKGAFNTIVEYFESESEARKRYPDCEWLIVEYPDTGEKGRMPNAAFEKSYGRKPSTGLSFKYTDKYSGKTYTVKVAKMLGMQNSYDMVMASKRSPKNFDFADIMNKPGKYWLVEVLHINNRKDAKKEEGLIKLNNGKPIQSGITVGSPSQNDWYKILKGPFNTRQEALDSK